MDIRWCIKWIGALLPALQVQQTTRRYCNSPILTMQFKSKTRKMLPKEDLGSDLDSDSLFCHG